MASSNGMIKPLCLLFVFLLASVFAHAGDPHPVAFFDLGKTIVETIENSDGDIVDVHWMPGAVAYLTELKANGFPVGLIVNLPDSWGDTTAKKIEKMKQFIGEHWTDHTAMDWTYFTAGILVPPSDQLRKPNPYLFEQARELARSEGRRAVFQGENAEEVAVAIKVGMGARRVNDGGNFYLPVSELDSWAREHSTNLQSAKQIMSCRGVL